MIKSLRARLILILVLLVAAATASGFIMLALFEQSASAQIGQAERGGGRACDAIGRAYRFYTTGWRGGPPDLADAGAAANSRPSRSRRCATRPASKAASGRRKRAPRLCVSHLRGQRPQDRRARRPSCRGSPPPAGSRKSDDRPQLTRVDARRRRCSIAACPLSGPIPHLLGLDDDARPQLRGRDLLAADDAASPSCVLAVGLASRHGGRADHDLVAPRRRIEACSAPQDGAELPTLRLTGERELDRIVLALNDAGQRLIASRRQAERPGAPGVDRRAARRRRAGRRPASRTRSATRSPPCG